ncbi:IS66 family insertion sequence element accessory protein TnpB [Gelidibacter maritimus]|uniref:IS66 family insertion sequence element accessory protein TnpB n=1 Tax=Gelidibacter maritimus TaxID=2761487 RepID=A0A7W2M4T0_9FLAO|nr:IS66 family insertion sequence element accessory protein TnpB [Gelidibacter maritimus]MBA6152700.1 IS66 family insertion sequence element accessory protein TnpB [Gelidibacter maritimus]
MFSLSSSHTFLLYPKVCDMRKGFNGLCGIVTYELGRTAHSGEVFVFINRKNNRMKLLHWESGGFVLYYKRLEQGTFAKIKEGKVQISWSDLVLMVEGIQVLKSSRKRRFLL